MKLHKKILKLRKDKKWSQVDLAEKIGSHVAHISRLENGKSKPSVDMLQKLAKIFAVTMDYLMDDNADETPSISTKNKPLAEKLILLDKLDDTDKQTITNVIDSMLTKKKMLDILQPEHSEN